MIFNQNGKRSKLVMHNYTYTVCKEKKKLRKGNEADDTARMTRSAKKRADPCEVDVKGM